MRTLQLLFILSLLPQSGFASELILNASVADASVYEVVRAEGVETEKLLGKTPFEIKEVNGSTDHLYKIEKEGFSPVYIPILHSTKGDSTIKVSLRKHQDWIPEDAANRASAIAEKQIEEILTVQMLLEQKKLGEALSKAEDLKRDYPGSTGAELVYANALLMNGQVDRAVTLYSSLAQELPESKATLKATLKSLILKLNRGKK